MTKKKIVIGVVALVLVASFAAMYFVMRGDPSHLVVLEAYAPPEFEGWTLVVQPLKGKSSGATSIFVPSHILDVEPSGGQITCDSDVRMEAARLSNANYAYDAEKAYRYFSVETSYMSLLVLAKQREYVESSTGLPLLRGEIGGGGDYADLTVAFSVSTISATAEYERCLKQSLVPGHYKYPNMFLVGGLAVVSYRAKAVKGKVSEGTTLTDMRVDLSSASLRYIQFGYGKKTDSDIVQELRKPDASAKSIIDSFQSQIEKYTIIGVKQKEIDIQVND
ncbi:MAG TPA: hypothetical protein VL463_29395 [Kofleriaceae bacterium]|jgi:hypothetical protein|nr:hypothetical protein [Kofleriaceae bacterium]